MWKPKRHPDCPAHRFCVEWIGPGDAPAWLENGRFFGNYPTRIEAATRAQVHNLAEELRQ